MHSILFVLEQPDAHDINAMNAYRLAIAALSSSQMQDELAERLSGNVLLLRASGGLPLLGKVIQVAEESKLRYRVLFLKKEPQWICSKE